MKISIPGPKLEQVTVFFQVNKLLSGKKEGLGSGLLLQRTEIMTPEEEPCWSQCRWGNL